MDFEPILKVAVVMVTVLGIPTAFMYLIVPLVRSLGRRIDADGTLDEAELNALRAEIEMLRDLPARVAELEDRADFAERALQRAREDAMQGLPGGNHAAG